MNLKNMLLAGLAGLSFSGQPHPLHLSYTHLEYKPANSHWEVTVKIFSDDFSDALNLAGLSGFDVLTEPGSKDRGSGLQEWLGRQISIELDDQLYPPEQWSLKSWKNKESATWMVFAFKAGKPVLNARIKNSLLLDLYSDQKNLFIFTMGQAEFAYELDHLRQTVLIPVSK